MIPVLQVPVLNLLHHAILLRDSAASHILRSNPRPAASPSGSTLAECSAYVLVMNESPRIDVHWDELAVAIRLWIRTSPAMIWREDSRYEALRVQKRHDPSRAPDPRGDLAAFLADRFARMDWRVTRPEPAPVVDRSGSPHPPEARD